MKRKQVRREIRSVWIGCRLQAAAANKRLRKTISQCAYNLLKRTNLGTACHALLPKIVEVKSQWLAVFIVRDYQFVGRLRSSGCGIGVARLLALRFALGFLNPLFLPGAFLLALGKSCTRASCHNPQSISNNLDILIAFYVQKIQRFVLSRALPLSYRFYRKADLSPRIPVRKMFAHPAVVYTIFGVGRSFSASKKRATGGAPGRRRGWRLSIRSELPRGGDETSVNRSRAEEAHEHAGVIGSVHYGHPYAVGIVNRGELAAADRIIQLQENPGVEQKAVIHVVRVNEESADCLGVVDARSLRSTYGSGNVDHLKHASDLVIDVRKIGRRVVGAQAVVARCLMEVVLSQQLVEGGSGKVDVGIGATTGVGETVRNAVLVDIEAVGRQAVVDADDLGHHRAGKVLGGVVSGQCE